MCIPAWSSATPSGLTQVGCMGFTGRAVHVDVHEFTIAEQVVHVSPTCVREGLNFACVCCMLHIACIGCHVDWQHPLFYKCCSV